MQNGKTSWKSFFCCVVMLFSAARMSGAQSAGQLALISGRPGGMCVYELRFTSSDTLPPEAALELVLPRSFDVSRAQLASSDIMKGGFAVYVVGDTLRIVRSGLGPAVLPGTMVDLKVAAVRAPKEVPASAKATLRILPHRSQATHVLLVPVTNDTTRVVR